MGWCRVSDLETRMQTRWAMFERKWEEKIIEADSKEGASTDADHRIRVCRVTGRIAWNGGIRSQRTKVETLKSELQRLREVVCMKNRPNGSVAEYSGDLHWQRWEHGHFAAHVMQNTNVASRIELKCKVVWRSTRGTGITMDEARDLVTQVQILIPETDMDKFDCDLTARGQRNFDIKKMTFLWFKDGVTPQDLKRVQLDLQQALVRLFITKESL